MKKYKVSSGDLDNYEVEAETPQLAAAKAIEEGKPKGLGFIMITEEIGGNPDDDMILLTEYVITEVMGLKFEK
jgi:hypothetical protein